MTRRRPRPANTVGRRRDRNLRGGDGALRASEDGRAQGLPAILRRPHPPGADQEAPRQDGEEQDRQAAGPGLPTPAPGPAARPPAAAWVEVLPGEGQGRGGRQ
jgi:hypothetical protein